MRYIVWIFSLIIFSSCEDFFRTTVKVDPPPYVKGMVVNLYIDDVDTLLKASVSHNVGSLDPVKEISQLLLPDATVEILDEQENLVLTMDTVMPQGGENMINFICRLDTAFGGTGRRFTLQVTHPEYGVATAVQTMPRKPVISHPVYKAQAGYNDYSGGYGLLSFDIQDIAGEENFYQISAFYLDPDNGQPYYLTLESDNPLFDHALDWSILMQDKTFDGESYPVQLKVYGPYVDENDTPVEDAKVFVDIRSVTKDYYLYALSLERADEAEDIGLFVEPVQVYDNVTNGFGIFALSARNVVLAGKE